MQLKLQKTTVAAAVAATLGAGAAALPGAASAVGLADGYYDMIINSAPNGGIYYFDTPGIWNSSFTFGCLPGSKGCSSNLMYDDTVASPVNGKYAGNPNDGVQGTVGITVVGGVITGAGFFEFDTIPGTAGGAFAEYGGSGGFTGTVDGAGNISLTPTGLLGTVSSFPSLVDEAWNVDNFNGGVGTGTSFTANPPNSNTTYDAFTTGATSNTKGTINGSAYDGSNAVLVKGGTLGSEWGGFFGAQYFEVWNVSFRAICPAGTGTGLSASCTPPPVPVPAAVWLFGSGLVGLIGIARRRKIEGG